MLSDVILRERLLAQSQMPVSPITLSDYRLYRAFFRQDDREAPYANTFTYITQACRVFGLGIKYVVDGALYSIGAHHGHYVVVRPLGTLAPDLFDLLVLLNALSEKPVFIKKLFPDQSAYLGCQAGFELVKPTRCETDAHNHIVWDKSAYADDDSYPELIYDHAVLSHYDLRLDDWGELFTARRRSPLNQKRLKSYKHRFKNLRRWLRNARRIWGKHIVYRYAPHRIEPVTEFLTSYFQDRPAHLAAHLNALHMIPDVDDDDYFGLVTYVENHEKPVAFHVGERSSANAVSMCVGVASREITGLGAYIYYYLFEYLEPFAVYQINVGGSETQSLDHFKRIPAPIEERRMDMMVYNPIISR